MIIKARHFGIIVKNINKSKFFYSNILGLKIQKELLEEGVYFNNLIKLKNRKAKVVKIDIPDSTYIELIQFINEKKNILTRTNSFKKLKQMHICFTVRNIEKYYRRLKQYKVKFKSPPLKSDFDPVKTCFFLDPDKNFVQIVEDTKWGYK